MNRVTCLARNARNKQLLPYVDMRSSETEPDDAEEAAFRAAFLAHLRTRHLERLGLSPVAAAAVAGVPPPPPPTAAATRPPAVPAAPTAPLVPPALPAQVLAELTQVFRTGSQAALGVGLGSSSSTSALRSALQLPYPVRAPPRQQHYRIEFRDIDLRVATVTGIEVVFVNAALDEGRFAVYPTALFAWNHRLEQLAEAVQAHVATRSRHKWLEAIERLRLDSPELLQQLQKPFKDGGMLPVGAAAAGDASLVSAQELDANLIDATYKCTAYFQAHGDIRSATDLQAPQHRAQTLRIGDDVVPVPELLAQGRALKVTASLDNVYLLQKRLQAQRE